MHPPCWGGGGGATNIQFITQLLVWCSYGYIGTRERHPKRVKRGRKQDGRGVKGFAKFQTKSKSQTTFQAMKLTAPLHPLCRHPQHIESGAVIHRQTAETCLACIISFRNLNLSPIFKDWKTSHKNLDFWLLSKNQITSHWGCRSTKRPSA